MKTTSAIHLAALMAAALAQPAHAEQGPTREIQAAAGVTGGVAVQIGCGPSQVAQSTALHAGGKFLVQGLDADPACVDRARAAIRAAGSCGPISVVPWADPSRLPYADNLVNVSVVRGPSSVAEEEVLRVLRPGGVALFTTNNGHAATDKTLKPWPAEIDEWSHWEHGADGNPVSMDSVAGPPRELQWIAGPTSRNRPEAATARKISPCTPYVSPEPPNNGETSWRFPGPPKAGRSSRLIWRRMAT